MMNAALQYRQAILHIYQSSYREQYERRLLGVCAHLAEVYIESLRCGEPIDEEYQSAIVQAYSCECFGQIINWVDGGMSIETQKRFLRAIAIRQGSTQRLIRENGDAKNEQQEN